MGMIRLLSAIGLPLSFQTQDTLTHHFLDSVVVRSPLPDPLVPIVQWIFQKPGWLMAGGIVVGALAAYSGPSVSGSPCWLRWLVS